MGAWGHGPDENDGFLDLLYCVMRPIRKALNLPKGGKYLCYRMDDAISASYLLYEIMKNEKLRYKNELDLIEDAKLALGRVLEEYNFDIWRDPKKKRRKVRELRNKLSGIKTCRYTTLFAKCRKGREKRMKEEKKASK